MKKNFGDHSANERTFLAWIRTGIAVMAFGFLVEKFTLFLNYIRIALHQAAVSNDTATGAIGLAFIVVGACMIAVATGRFLIFERQIDLPEERDGNLILPDVLLGVLVALTGLFLALYLGFRLGH